MKVTSPLFIRLCSYMDIPYTEDFTSKIYEEHPYKASMYGLSQLLKLYGVENEGVKFHDKSVLSDIKPPFVAHVGSDLVLVKEIKDGKVAYEWQGSDQTSTLDVFMSGWSGNALIFQKTPNSSEPEYQKHRSQVLWKRCQLVFIIFIAIILLLRRIHEVDVWSDWRMAFSIVISLMGLYVSYLLLGQQIGTGNKTASVLCGIWRKSHCDTVQKSDASKLFGHISWSEVGFAYFLCNAMAVLIQPAALYAISMFSVCSSLFAVWSIWYQYRIAKAWCVLCLMVQFLLVVQASISISVLSPWMLIVFQIQFFGNLIAMGLFYLLTLLIVHRLTPFISDAYRAVKWKSEIKSIKNNVHYFLSLQKIQKDGQVSPSPSTIIFGNPNSDMRVTLLTNPFCSSCAEIHKKLQSLLDADICLQLNLSSFGQEYDRVCLQMIAVYLQYGPEKAWEVYGRWFSMEKSGRTQFWEQYHLDYDTPSVVAEYEAHKQWVRDNGLNATPLLYVNNMAVPYSYSPEEVFDMLKYEYPTD